jgi:hypothetical protein
MDRHKSTARGHVVQQSPFFAWRDAVNVRVQHERIEVSEVFRIELGNVIGVDQIDAALGQHGLKLSEPLLGPMRAVVTKEKHVEILGS